jgi:hypothetical protein
MEKAVFTHANGTITLTYDADQQTVLVDFSAPCYLTLTEAQDFHDVLASYLVQIRDQVSQTSSGSPPVVPPTDVTGETPP